MLHASHSARISIDRFIRYTYIYTKLREGSLLAAEFTEYCLIRIIGYYFA